MSAEASVVITGLGVVSPLGIGYQASWDALLAGRTGLRRITEFDPVNLRSKLAGEIVDFDPAEFVKPRKSLKVMARDAQLTIAAAGMAREHANLGADDVDPDRFGVLFGGGVIRSPLAEVAGPYAACTDDQGYDFSRWGTDGLATCFPLGMLKLLPNMLACHISIMHDARGPNNTICQGNASGLVAIGEAMRVIQRGQADVMIGGGASSRANAYDLVRLQLTEEVTDCDDPERACRPFDIDRNGQLMGEGAAALLLENRVHAEQRGAPILAEVLGVGTAGEAVTPSRPFDGTSIRAAVRRALNDAKLSPQEIGFVVAHGLATRAGDFIEATALAEVLPGRPVLGMKGYMGGLGPADGAVEAAVAVLALDHGHVPPTLHCDRPDPSCPISVIHGRPLTTFARTCVLVTYTLAGQAAALVLAKR
ncbi:MAG: beta-ketoacyl-[acyl-carrier-protein] synthase family protein [Planctomycetia bacterium]|nr:beta-ketoacyl-[acyl-carrier-protein] synthase family protein [Planctomycetia bacterium]